MKPMRRNLVAAVRWDYEVGLQSQAEIARKYRQVMHPATAYGICARRIHPDVAPVRNNLAWAKLSWRASVK